MSEWRRVKKVLERPTDKDKKGKTSKGREGKRENFGDIGFVFVLLGEVPHHVAQCLLDCLFCWRFLLLLLFRFRVVCKLNSVAFFCVVRECSPIEEKAAHKQ